MNFSSKELNTFLKKTYSLPLLKKISWCTIFISKSLFDLFKRRFNGIIKSETKKNIASKQNTLWVGECYEKLKY